MRTWTNGRSRGAGAAITLVAMAAVLGACGSSSSPKSAPANKPATAVSGAKVLLASVQTTAATKSARVSLTVSGSGAGASAFSLKADGAVDFATGDSQFTADLGGMMSSMLPGGLEMRVVDKVSYVKLPASITRFFGGSGSAQWIAIDQSKLGSKTSPFSGLGQSDPTKFLAYIETVSDDVKTVGSDTIRGVDTTHYHATLDLGKAIDQAKIPQALRDKVKGLLQRGGAQVPTIPADVWVDGDGHVRRIRLDVDTASFAGLAAGASGATGSLPTVTVSMDLYDFGTPVNVQAPPADQIISLKDFGMNGGGPFGIHSPDPVNGNVAPA